MQDESCREAITTLVYKIAKSKNYTVERVCSHVSESLYFTLRNDKNKIKFRISSHHNNNSRQMHGITIGKNTKIGKVERFVNHICEDLRVKSVLEALSILSDERKNYYYIKSNEGYFRLSWSDPSTESIMFDSERSRAFYYDSPEEALEIIQAYNIQDAEIVDYFGRALNIKVETNETGNDK